LFFFLSGGAIIAIGWTTYFYIIFLAILAGCFLLSRKRLKASAPALRNILIMGSFFTVLMLLRGESIAFQDNGTIILKFAILIVFSIYVATFFGTNELFFTSLVSVFEFLIKLSLATFVITNVVPSLLVNIGPKTVLGDQFQTLFGIAYARSADFLKYKFYRNQSIFWEPGVFSVFIIITYMLKVFYLKNRKRMFWYILAIFSTLSMGGITIFMLMLVSRFLFAGSTKQFNEKLPALALLVGVPLFAIVDFIYSYSSDIELLAGALFHRNLSSDTSVNTRYQDLYYGFLASKNKIWAGHGQDFTDFYNTTAAAINSSKESYNGGITNAIIAILFCYGIFFLCYYIYNMFKSSIELSSNSRYALIMFFTLIGALMLEPLHFSLAILFIFTFRESKKTLLT